jgi:hypothetical protein
MNLLKTLLIGTALSFATRGEAQTLPDVVPPQGLPDTTRPSKAGFHLENFEVDHLQDENHTLVVRMNYAGGNNDTKTKVTLTETSMYFGKLAKDGHMRNYEMLDQKMWLTLAGQDEDSVAIYHNNYGDWEAGYGNAENTNAFGTVSRRKQELQKLSSIHALTDRDGYNNAYRQRPHYQDDLRTMFDLTLTSIGASVDAQQYADLVRGLMKDLKEGKKMMIAKPYKTHIDFLPPLVLKRH